MLISKSLHQFVVKIVLMVKIGRGGAYSYELVKDLSAHGGLKYLAKDREALKNDVYNNIASLEKSGFIKASSAQGGDGKRKYYALTPKGRAAVKAAKTGMRRTLVNLSKMLK